MSIEDRVREIIYEQLDVGGWNGIEKADDLKREHSLRDDLSADSLDEVELIMYLEEDFDCEIEDVDAENINTVGDVLDYAKTHFSS